MTRDFAYLEIFFPRFPWSFRSSFLANVISLNGILNLVLLYHVKRFRWIDLGILILGGFCFLLTLAQGVLFPQCSVIFSGELLFSHGDLQES